MGQRKSAQGSLSLLWFLSQSVVKENLLRDTIKFLDWSLPLFRSCLHESICRISRLLFWLLFRWYSSDEIIAYFLVPKKQDNWTYMQFQKVHSDVVLRSFEKIVNELDHREANFKVRIGWERIFDPKIELIGFEQTSSIILSFDHFFFTHSFRFYFVCIHCEGTFSD